MGWHDIRPCSCGSGKDSWWLFDARNIPCSRVCEDCEDAKRAKYRIDVLENPNYECDERIDDDY